VFINPVLITALGLALGAVRRGDCYGGDPPRRHKGADASLGHRLADSPDWRFNLWEKNHCRFIVV